MILVVAGITCGLVAALVVAGLVPLPTVVAANQKSDEGMSRFEAQISTARYYIPVYGAGAAYAAWSQDRRAEAADSLETGRAVEARQTDGMVGERDVEEIIESFRLSLEMDDEELPEFLSDDTLLADFLDDERGALRGGDSERLVPVQPIHSELADLCGESGAVTIYASGGAGAQPALGQWRTVRSAPTRPAGVVEAWHLNPDDDVTAYAWQPVDVPEILVVASSPGCGCPIWWRRSPSSEGSDASRMAVAMNSRVDAEKRSALR